MNVDPQGEFERNGIVDSRLLPETSGGRAVWELLQPVIYSNNRGVEIKAPRGFQTDFASVPRFFWRVVPPAGPHGAAAVVHDYLYVHQGDWNRKDVDVLFHECLGVLGVPDWKRNLMYLGVRLGGWLGWNRNKRRWAKTRGR